MYEPSAEVIAARGVVVFIIEAAVRARTAFIVWAAALIAAIFVIGAVKSDGIGAFIVGVLALVAATVAVTLFGARAALLRALRRYGGGRDYPRVKPIIERHLDSVQRARASVPKDRFGFARLIWMARRPAKLGEYVRETGRELANAIPDVVADVRRELNP